MVDKAFADEMLRNIELNGAADISDAKVNHIINGNMAHILDLGSGIPKIYHTVKSRFKLIVSQPKILQAFYSVEIRCGLCNKVISYPCWYYSVKYAINHFHYFVCFNPLTSDKVTAKCYRRS